jgi:hypothetical protein
MLFKFQLQHDYCRQQWQRLTNDRPEFSSEREHQKGNTVTLRRGEKKKKKSWVKSADWAWHQYIPAGWPSVVMRLWQRSHHIRCTRRRSYCAVTPTVKTTVLLQFAVWFGPFRPSSRNDNKLIHARILMICTYKYFQLQRTVWICRFRHKMSEVITYKIVWTFFGYHISLSFKMNVCPTVARFIILSIYIYICIWIRWGHPHIPDAVFCKGPLFHGISSSFMHFVVFLWLSYVGSDVNYFCIFLKTNCHVLLFPLHSS